MGYSFLLLLRDAPLDFRFGSSLPSNGSGPWGCRFLSSSLRSFLRWSFSISLRVLAIFSTFPSLDMQTDIEVSGGSTRNRQSLAHDPQARLRLHSGWDSEKDLFLPALANEEKNAVTPSNGLLRGNAQIVMKIRPRLTRQMGLPICPEASHAIPPTCPPLPKLPHPKRCERTEEAPHKQGENLRPLRIEMPAAESSIPVIDPMCAKVLRKAEPDAPKMRDSALEKDPAQKLLIEAESMGGKFLLQIGEDILAPGPGKEIPELLFPSIGGWPSAGTFGTEASASDTIISLSFLLIREAGIGFADLLEAILCSFISRIAVGMAFEGQPAISLPDLFLASPCFQAQGLIVILMERSSSDHFPFHANLEALQ